MGDQTYKDLDSIKNMCWKSGVNQTRKVKDISIHRDSVSGKTNCPCHVNFYLGRCTGVIKLTQLLNEHNHQCDSKTIDLAPKNLKLSQTILDKIEHYTVFGHLDASQRYDLSYQGIFRTPYNAISKFRGIRIHNEFDAVVIHFEQREEDQEYIIIPRLGGPNND